MDDELFVAGTWQAHGLAAMLPPRAANGLGNTTPS